MALFIRLIIRIFQLVFSAGTVFSLTTNQSTVFSSRLISTVERAHLLEEFAKKNILPCDSNLKKILNTRIVNSARTL
jgi:hypothetical protein